MKAIVCTKYGSLDVLQLQEVAKPAPKEDEVLIRIHASSIISRDWRLMRAKLKPAILTFEQAAAVPVAAMTALQGISHAGGIRPGQGVLINGASGGVGTFAVQIAKAFGAEVTAVCSTRNNESLNTLL